MKVRLKAPKDTESVCVGGENMELDADGCVEVESSHVNNLVHGHGFKPAPAAPAPKKVPASEKDKK